VFQKALSVSVALAVAATVALGRPQEDAPKAAPAGPVETAFIQEAALDGLTQLDICYDALAESRRRDVRAFALDTANLRAPALKDLEQLAKPREVAFPTNLVDYPAYIPDRPWQSEGANFDVEFMRDQVRRHEQLVDAYARETVDGIDPDVRSYAWANILQLRQRLARARELLERVEAAALTGGGSTPGD
jgi:putative membrane protein